MQKVCGVVWCCTGDRDEAEEALRPAREFGPPLLDGVAPMPFPGLQSAFDEVYPAGLQWYWKADFVDALPDEAIAAHVEHGAAAAEHALDHAPVPDRRRGARRRPGRDRVRLPRLALGGGDRRRRPRPGERRRDHRRGPSDYYEALHPHSAGGAYVNFLMHDEGPERVKATYRDNYDRLVEVKRRYDPDNCSG